MKMLISCFTTIVFALIVTQAFAQLHTVNPNSASEPDPEKNSVMYFRDKAVKIENLELNIPEGENFVILGNPVQGNTRVFFRRCPPEEVIVRVLDFNGKIRIQRKEFANTCNTIITLPTEPLPQGMYLIEMSSGKRQYMQRMLKM